ncbi:BMP family ABC transporter substrate-binding protein [Bordetella genomosp. 12]|uniref:BMP family ABC transporter substrate-binding protein n=1 Tax=Bordetella genomosp. 12 TaxID=463035 RepID=A0A261VC30_9BORD|nr:BMP family ABC transporter substrate-binding protein [Bordetella genomosp. 12]OZI71708.1 BMP family ABC transporter substrate-binding protein [Bordetella genomosp. 12]
MSARRVLVLFGQAGGFNEAALAGADRAARAGQALAVHWIRDGQAREQALRELCARSPDLVIVHGGQGDAPVAAVAHDFPQTQFAITQGSFVAANVASYEILQEHTAFLAGVLAALRAGDGAAAHLSGERVRPGLKGRAAYADGVRRISGREPLSGFCGNQHDPDLARVWGQALIAQRARVIFAMLDGGRPGLSAACRQAGVWQIGNVIDWVARDPQVFLASALADSGLCVQRAAADHAAARLATGCLTTFGLEHPHALRLVLGKEVSAAERAVLDGWAAGLNEGRIAPAQGFAGAEFLPVSEALPG